MTGKRKRSDPGIFPGQSYTSRFIKHDSSHVIRQASLSRKELDDIKESLYRCLRAIPRPIIPSSSFVNRPLINTRTVDTRPINAPSDNDVHDSTGNAEGLGRNGPTSNHDHSSPAMFNSAAKPAGSSGNAEPTGYGGPSDNASAPVDDAGEVSTFVHTSSFNSNSNSRTEPLPTSVGSPWLCWICRRPFQLSSETKDNWKCFHQPVGVGSDGVLPPSKKCTSEDKPAIHSCCWEIACKALERSRLNISRRIDMIKYLCYLSAFATETPFDTETDSLDLELFSDPESISISPDENDSQPIMLEALLSAVERLLHQKDSVITIDELQKADPCLAQWMAMANAYSIKMNRSPNIRLPLERVVRNLRESDASRFPKTYNFRVAWHNAQQAIQIMENLAQPQIIPQDPLMKGKGRYTRYCMSMEKTRRLSFFFYPCNGSRLHRLTGVVCDGVVLGSCPIANPFARAIHLPMKSRPVQSLRGLRLAQTSTGHITALQFRHGDTWGDVWYGAPEHACDDVQVEWNESKEDLVIHYDALQKDIKKIIPRPRMDSRPQ